MKFYEVL